MSVAFDKVKPGSDAIAFRNLKNSKLPMKPNKKTMMEAADLLACCASQSDGGGLTTGSASRFCFGQWSDKSIRLAEDAWDAVYDRGIGLDLDWREHYAEAEADVRKKLEAQ